MGDALLTLVSILLGMLGVGCIVSGFRHDSKLLPALLVGGSILVVGVCLMPDHSEPGLLDAERPFYRR